MLEQLWNHLSPGYPSRASPGLGWWIGRSQENGIRSKLRIWTRTRDCWVYYETIDEMSPGFFLSCDKIKVVVVVYFHWVECQLTEMFRCFRSGALLLSERAVHRCWSSFGFAILAAQYGGEIGWMDSKHRRLFKSCRWQCGSCWFESLNFGSGTAQQMRRLWHLACHIGTTQTSQLFVQ